MKHLSTYNELKKNLNSRVMANEIEVRNKIKLKILKNFVGTKTVKGESPVF